MPVLPMLYLALQPVPPAPSELDLLSSIFAALQGGWWLGAVGFGIVLLVQAAKRYATRFVPWFGTGVGAVTLALSLGILASVGASLSTVGFSLTAEAIISTLINGIVAGLTAAGLYSASNAVVKSGQPTTPVTPPTPPL
jgi:hypothetical protein